MAFDMFINYNENKTEAYINIKPNSNFDESNIEAALDEMFQIIKTSVTVSGISFGLLDEELLKSSLRGYFELSYHERKSKVCQYCIAKGIAPIDGEDSKFIEYKFTYDNITEDYNLKDEKLDHKNKGFDSKIIEKDTKLFTFVKPSNGKEGKDINGNLIQQRVGELRHNINYDKNSIYNFEFSDRIDFFASKSGFLTKDSEGKYSIDNKIFLDSIDYNIGNINATKVENAQINIEGKGDSNEDVVKSGFKIEADVVNIIGNVAEDVTISAKSIFIKGVVAKGSKISADVVKINTSYQNYIEGNEVFIVEGNQVNVNSKSSFLKNIISSEIKGQEITVIGESKGGRFITNKFIFINNLVGKGANQIIQIVPFLSNDINDKVNNIYILKQERDTLLKKYNEFKNKEKELPEKTKNIDILLNSLIKDYFPFLENSDPARREAFKYLIINKQWEVLEKKFNVKFQPYDMGKMIKIAESHKRLSKGDDFVVNYQETIDELEVKIKESETLLKNVNILVMNHKDALLTIQIGVDSGSKIVLKDDIKTPYIITFSELFPRIENLNKFHIKNIQNLITEASYKFVSKFLR